MNTTSVEVTAGLGGFLVVFALALAVWFLGRDLTRRLRRMNRAEQLRVSAQTPPTPPARAEGEEPDGEAPGGEGPGGVGASGPVPPRTDA